MDEAAFKALAALVFAIVMLIGLGIYLAATEPKCPQGSEAKVIHSTWYCVTPKVTK